MDRRTFVRAGGLLALGSALDPSIRSAAQNYTEATARHTGRSAWEGYDRAVVVDALASPGPFNVQDPIARPLSPEMLRNVRESGITAVNLTVNGRGQGPEAFVSTVAGIAYWERELSTHPDTILKARSAADIRSAEASDRLALVFGFQDANMLEGKADRLEIFQNLGVRIVQLTYNVRNELGDGCLVPENGGLTELGREVVARMNDGGTLVDLSHCGQRTTAEAITASRAPVAITHSGCRAVYDHPRSKRDEEIRAMADRGGVMGIYLMPFLNSEGPPTREDVIRHLEHAIQVAGEDHVGIGSDLSITPLVPNDDTRRLYRESAAERQRLGIGAPREYEIPYVDDLNSPRRLEMIADLLLARGHGEARVEKIVGGNFLRLFEEVWGG